MDLTLFHEGEHRRFAEPLEPQEDGSYLFTASAPGGMPMSLVIGSPIPSRSEVAEKMLDWSRRYPEQFLQALFALPEAQRKRLLLAATDRETFDWETTKANLREAQRAMAGGNVPIPSPVPVSPGFVYTVPDRTPEELAKLVATASVPIDATSTQEATTKATPPGAPKQSAKKPTTPAATPASPVRKRSVKSGRATASARSAASSKAKSRSRL